MISLWAFFFKVLATEPGRCARCFGPILVGDAVVPAPDPALGPLWHRACVWTTDSEADRFRRARRRKTQPRATAGDARQSELFPAPPDRSELHGELTERQGDAGASEGHRGPIVPVGGRDERCQPARDLEQEQPRRSPHAASVAHGRRG